MTLPADLPLEPFRPLCESLEWQLAQEAWSRGGTGLFARGEVPYVINNSGRLSESLASILLALCRRRGTGTEPIEVLELGAGSGLFARYFVSAFRKLCQQQATDFAQRLIYFASDRAVSSVEQWQKQGLFADLEVRVICGSCPADAPQRFEPLDPQQPRPRQLTMVIANYVLDVLPFAVVRRSRGGMEQLVVQTTLPAPTIDLSPWTRATREQLRRAASDPRDPARIELQKIAPLLELAIAFRPCTNAEVPYLPEAEAWGGDLPALPINHGAMRALEACCAQLAPEGVIALNDYGPTRREQLASINALQRFGPTVATGLNFPFLEHWLAQQGLQVEIPAGDEKRAIHARLVGRSMPSTVIEQFHRQQSVETHSWYEAPVEEANAHLATGRQDAALDAYRLALSRSPNDWQLLGRTAEFVLVQRKEFGVGLELVQRALMLNRWTSPWLWNVLGECLFGLTRFDAAREAYGCAEAIDPNDVRTNFNLACCHARAGEQGAALAYIARGLAYDDAGSYRELLLEQQRQILQVVAARGTSEHEALTKRTLVLAAMAQARSLDST